MAKPAPKWRRRKEERPDDIVRAALTVFAEKGFAGARMDEIATLAGVSKGAVYLYFPTKEALFAAVVRDAVWPNMAPLTDALARHEGPVAPMIRAMGEKLATLAVETPIGRVVKIVVGESGNFPEIARIWHDTVLAQALGALTRLIERGQTRGEIRAGDARSFAVSIISPLLVAVIFRETFVVIGAKPFDIPKLVTQHLDTVLPGMDAKDGKP